MGFRPSDVDQMSIWEFLACVDGWNAAHGGDNGPDADPMSPERMIDLGLM